MSCPSRKWHIPLKIHAHADGRMHLSFRFSINERMLQSHIIHC